MSTPAGWYDDGSGRLRWWDGQQWTEHFADQQSAAPEAPAAAQGAAEPAGDERKFADEAPEQDGAGQEGAEQDAPEQDGASQDGAEAIAATPEPSPVPAPTPMPGDASQPLQDPASSAAPMPPQPAYAAAPATPQGGYAAQPGAVAPQEPKKSRTGLIVGIVVGAVVLLLAIAGVAIALAVGGLLSAVSGPNDATDALYDAWATEDCAAEFALTTEFYNGGDEAAFCANPDYSFLDGMVSYEITGTTIENSTATVTVDEDWGDFVDVWQYELVQVDDEWLVDAVDFVETR